MRRKVKGEVRHELWVKITLFKSECTEHSSLEAGGAAWSGCSWGVCTALWLCTNCGPLTAMCI